MFVSAALLLVMSSSV